MVVRKAESFEAGITEQPRRENLTGLPVPHLAALRRKRNFAKTFFKAKKMQDTGTVGANLDTGSDLAEGLRLFQHANLEAFASQAVC